MSEKKYEFELYSSSGVLIADISTYATGRNWTKERNAPETLSFTLDVRAFEDFCASIGETPQSILNPYTTDIKVKRNGEYLFGVHVYDLQFSGNDDSINVAVKADGFLNLLKDRYVSAEFSSTDAVDIVHGLITSTQAQDRGDFGISESLTQATTVDRDRTYERKNVKEAIIELTELVDGNFDFEFDENRALSTYGAIGTDKPDVVLTYPENIKTFTVNRTGINTFNKLTALGSGFGDEQLSSIAFNADSQLVFGVREQIVTYNSVLLQDTLDQHAEGDLDLVKDLLDIPTITVSGATLDLNEVGIGDRIQVTIEDHPWINNVDGTYRIEKISCTIDENDAEIITLTLDNYGL